MRLPPRRPPPRQKPASANSCCWGLSHCSRSQRSATASYYTLVGRFYVSTDDAYVRANNTMLGARVSGHIAAILPGDNVLVRAGDVIFRIDDGDYRIAVDAARSKIATQQATIDRIGRQITAMESAAEQSRAQLASRRPIRSVPISISIASRR